MSANDYLFRPAKRVAVCFTEMTMRHRKAFKQQRQEKAGSDSDTGSCDADDPELMLVEGHPGCRATLWSAYRNLACFVHLGDFCLAHTGACTQMNRLGQATQ